MSDIIALLLVLLPQVFFSQSIAVCDFIVDGVVHHSLVLDSDREFLNLVFPVDLGLRDLLLLEFLLSFVVDKFHDERIEFTRFPVCLSCLYFGDVFVDSHFLFMMLQVAVSQHVVVSLRCMLNSLASYFLQIEGD